MKEENKVEVGNVDNSSTQVSQPDKNDINMAFKNRRRFDRIKSFVKKVLLICFIVAGYLYLKYAPKEQQVVEEFPFDENVVTYGDISVAVEGDGVITANSIYNIVPKVTGEILKDYVEPGKFVNKDDILYVIDSKDINNSINQASYGVQQSNVAISQAQSAYNNIANQISDLKIYSNSDGYVENLKIAEGGYVNAMSPVCDIIEKNAYEVTLQFKTAVARNVAVGNRVSVFFIDYVSYIDGEVTKVSDSTSLSNMGAQVTDVTIRINTPGYSIQGAKVEATIFLNDGTQIQSLNNSYVSAKNATVVLSDSTGTVKELLVENGSFVHKGDLIAMLENSNLNKQLSDAKLSIDNAQISKKNAENNLSTTRKQLDNYYITSPISGKIVFKNNKVGDVISSYQQTTSNIMAIVADVSTMKFEMQIDELDITKIKVGQEVVVTIEALENKEFMGKVSNINTIGQNIGGNTNYTIVIEIPGTEEIYSGMTADASVKVAEKDNVLIVPLNAVRKGDVVYKKSSDTEYKDEDEAVPKGYEKVKVEIGLNNSKFAEIISGVSSGDIVLTDKMKESGKFNMQNLANMMREN